MFDKCTFLTVALPKEIEDLQKEIESNGGNYLGVPIVLPKNFPEEEQAVNIVLIKNDGVVN